MEEKKERIKKEAIRDRIQDYFLELVNSCSPCGEGIERKDVDIIMAKMNVFYYEVIEAEKLKSREEGILIGVFGEDNKCVEDKIADLRYLHSMGEISKEEYEKALSKLTIK